MRQSHFCVFSSAWARAMRRELAAGERDGSCRSRNAEVGTEVALPFRVPRSAFRIATAAPSAATKSLLSMLARPSRAAYITRPPARVEGIVTDELRSAH